MFVVSCVKQVPDATQVQIDPVTNTLIRGGVPFIMNPYDTHALEESIRLKDRFRVRSVALSMGPPNAGGTLCKALAVGVDRAVLLPGRFFVSPVERFSEKRGRERLLVPFTDAGHAISARPGSFGWFTGRSHKTGARGGQ